MIWIAAFNTQNFSLPLAPTLVVMLKPYSLLTFLLIGVLLSFTSCDDDDADQGRRFTETVADLLAADPQFSTLYGALERTGLDARLADPNQVQTIFAPTNAAIEASGVDLAALSDEELTNILNYHLLPGRILSRNVDFLTEESEFATNNTTSAGENAIPLSIIRDGSTLTFDGGEATVEGDALRGVNGAIYALESLLIPPTIADRAIRAGNFTMLLAALERTGLTEVLAAAGDYTVFAPTDEAFDTAGVDLTGLSDDAVRQLLLYHVLGAGVATEDIAAGQSFENTLSTDAPDGAMLSLFIDNPGTVTLNGSATVVTPDIFTANGVIHAIDEVLMPQSVVEFAVLADGLDSLVNALTAVGLVDTLVGNDDPITVFAPVNAAFASASDTIATLGTGQLTSVLLNHVAGGNLRSDGLTDGLQISTLSMQAVSVSTQDEDGEERDAVLITSDSTEVNFIQTDIQATDGVIHLIDGILLPNLQ